MIILDETHPWPARGWWDIGTVDPDSISWGGSSSAESLAQYEAPMVTIAYKTMAAIEFSLREVNPRLIAILCGPDYAARYAFEQDGGDIGEIHELEEFFLGGTLEELGYL